MNNSTLYVLAGPTGIGKSRLGISMAAKYNGEIISADSRQIYRYMDIGTAKPGPEERRKIRHHLIDLFSPDEIVSAGKYAELADKAMRDIWERGKKAFLVGGSGLYIRAALRGVFEGPGRDDEVRKSLEEERDRSGSLFLYERLKKIDGKCAAKIHPNDSRRIIRALEVYMVSGKKISEWHREAPWQDPDKQETATDGTAGRGILPNGFNCIVACLYQDMEELYRRIEARVDEMIAKGLAGEVKKLVEKGFGESFALKDTIGYKEILGYINGNMSLDETVALIKKNSRRFAKRQMTWFRGEKGLHWIEKKNGEDEERILAETEKAFGLQEHCFSHLEAMIKKMGAVPNE